MSDLIDTTEMYLRTVYELEEAGIRPLRARISERLGQSGPTVSQTVARMERDGLLKVQDDRAIELSPTGRQLAEAVMRRHRLAECLLVEVLGLPIDQVHEEACRWEHVMSDLVENRIIELLNGPTRSPFGNPIPREGALDPLERTLADLAITGYRGSVQVVRLDETLHAIGNLVAWLFPAGVTPGAKLSVEPAEDQVFIETSSERIELSIEHASHIYVVVLP